PKTIARRRQLPIPRATTRPTRASTAPTRRRARMGWSTPSAAGVWDEPSALQSEHASFDKRRENRMNDHDTIIDIAAVERTFTLSERKVKALRGVDMRVALGSFVVLMGPSGSGKTTLLNIVGGLDQPTAGSVSVAGRRLDELDGQELAELRRTIGF